MNTMHRRVDACLRNDRDNRPGAVTSSWSGIIAITRLWPMNRTAVRIAVCSVSLGIGLAVSTGCGDRDAAERDQVEQAQADWAAGPSTQAAADMRNQRSSAPGPASPLTAQNSAWPLSRRR